MRKTLILHIGMGKTGTTALQHFFWSNRRALETHDIAYPVYGSVAEAHHLISPHVPPFLKDVWEFKTVAEWAPRLRESGQSRILLSSELMAWALPEVVEAFCENVTEYFNLKIVIYVRRQDNMIMADFNQLVKSGSQKRELERVLERQIKRFDYEKLIQPWASCVGPDKIIVRPYEKKQFHGGDIREDFMHHAFGVALSHQFKVSQQDANPRLSSSALKYKLNLNKLMDDAEQTSRFNDLLMSYSAEEDGTTHVAFASHFLLSPDLRNHILDKSTESNGAVARLYLGRTEGRLFYEDPPREAYSSDSQTSIGEDSVAITRFISKQNPQLIDLLSKAIEVRLHSDKRLHREAVSFFIPCLLALESNS